MRTYWMSGNIPNAGTDLPIPTLSLSLFLRFFWCGPFFKSLCWMIQHFFCFTFLVFGSEASGISAPWLRVKPRPPTLESEVLVTGLPGKSHRFQLSWSLFSSLGKATLYMCMVYMWSEVKVMKSCPTLCDPMDYIACQAPLSVEFSR